MLDDVCLPYFAPPATHNQQLNKQQKRSMERQMANFHEHRRGYKMDEGWGRDIQIWPSTSFSCAKPKTGRKHEGGAIKLVGSCFLPSSPLPVPSFDFVDNQKKLDFLSDIFLKEVYDFVYPFSPPLASDDIYFLLFFESLPFRFLLVFYREKT